MQNGKTIKEIAEDAGVTYGMVLGWAHKAGFNTPRGREQAKFSVKEVSSILSQRGKKS